MQATIIYDQYHIPNNLRQHMLRVAALARIILDNWSGQKIDDKSIVTCAMYHDIAKPVNFDIEKQRQYVATDDEFNKVKQEISEMINKYGTDEHVAAIKIFQEIGSSEETIRLIKNLEWIYLPRLLNENDIPSLLVNYCDMRIGPKGILPIAMRFSDLKERAPFEGIDEIAELAPKLESLMQSNTSIDLNAITDDQINNQIENFE